MGGNVHEKSEFALIEIFIIHAGDLDHCLLIRELLFARVLIFKSDQHL